jgi:hypothetical protein
MVAPTVDLEFALLFITAGPSRYFCVVRSANSVLRRSPRELDRRASSVTALRHQSEREREKPLEVKETYYRGKRDLLYELGRNLNLLEMDHEQITAHVHAIYPSQFGSRKDEHLRLRLFALKDRVSHNVYTPLHLDVEDCA